MAVTDSFVFTQKQNRAEAARRMKSQLPAGSTNELLCDSAASSSVWADWPGSRLALKDILGEAFLASAAWQCVFACDAIRQNEFAAANVSIIGVNQQAIGARFAGNNL